MCTASEINSEQGTPAEFSSYFLSFLFWIFQGKGKAMGGFWGGGGRRGKRKGFWQLKNTQRTRKASRLIHWN